MVGPVVSPRQWEDPRVAVQWLMIETQGPFLSDDHPNLVDEISAI